jgi:hypothetical protein
MTLTIVPEILIPQLYILLLLKISNEHHRSFYFSLFFCNLVKTIVISLENMEFISQIFTGLEVTLYILLACLWGSLKGQL